METITAEKTSPRLLRDDPTTAARKKHSRDRKKQLAHRARQGLVGLGIAGGALVAVLSLRPRAVPVDLGKVTRGPLVVAIEESGTTRVKDRYVVSAPVAGSLSRLPLEPGDAVKEGDALAEMAPTLSPLLDTRTRAQTEARLAASIAALGQARAQATRAAAAKELADAEQARVTRLAATGAVSAQAHDEANFAARMRNEEAASATFAVKVAAEEVRMTRAALGQDGDHAERHITVVAPASGRVLRVQQKSAGVVQAGAPLVEVGDPAALEVVVDLLTTDAVQVKPGTEVVIQGWGGDAPLAGRVRLVEPSAFTKPSALGVDEQRVNLVVALTEGRASLGDGYRVEARFVLWQGNDVTKAPQGAVFRHGEGWAVFRIEHDVAKLTPVTIGHRGEKEVEIVGGLSPNADVAVHPGDRVKDGVRVEPR